MEDKQFISGIYNYCDRWCERCDFSDRCEIYFEERKNYNALQNKDDFIAIVSQNLSKAKELLIKMAEERGIDVDDLEDDEAYKKHRQKSKEARGHALSQHAMDYANQVHEWFQENDHLEIYKQRLEKNIELGIDLDESDKALRLIDEASNIINWYLFQMHIKLSSAIRYYPHDPEFEDEIQNMHHSSAKIAFIGLENSMKAWHTLLELLKDEEDFILHIIIHLQKLKAQTHKEFPLLRNYKRPFFED
jgi:hypothetical protein